LALPRGRNYCVAARLVSYRGQERLDIRLYYTKEGTKWAPTQSGTWFSLNEVRALRKSIRDATID
jgi:hypothetical protein